MSLISEYTLTDPLKFPVNLGSALEFDQIFRFYYPQLCDFSARYLKYKEDAEEVVANLFVILWNKAEVFESTEHLRAYLYRSAFNSSMNRIRSEVRRAERERTYSLQSDNLEESYLNNMLRSELIGGIYREIELLPSHYGKVINMSYRDGFKNDEIAAQLDLTIQTVKNYKHKGLSILKTKVSSEAWLAISAIVLTGM